MPLNEQIRGAGRAALETWRMLGRGQDPMLIEADQMRKLEEEMIGFRLLDGSTLDLTPYRHQRTQKDAFTLWRTVHMAKRVIGIFTDFLVGDAVTAVARHEDDDDREAIQEQIDRFWNDPVNACDQENMRRAEELFIWGEICMPVRVNERTGASRLGWVTPTSITEIEADPRTGEPGTLHLNEAAAEAVGQDKLDVIRFREDTETWEGEAFFYTINTLKGGHRGVSELYGGGEFMDILEDTLRSHADRAKHDANFIWDVTLEGYDEGAIKKWLRENGRKPRPNEIRAHNQKVSWNAVAPNLGAADFEAHTRTIKSYVLGGYAIPNHWYGSGDDANLATAAVMSEPTRKSLRRKQQVFRRILHDQLRFALLQAEKAGVLRTGLIAPGKDPFDVNLPDLSGPDMAKIGAAIQSLTNAVVVACEQEFLSKQTGRATIAVALAETGLDVDPETEAELIEGEKKSAAKDAPEDDLNARLKAAMGAGDNGEDPFASGEPAELEDSFPGG
jgi:hypothetical protein